MNRSTFFLTLICLAATPQPAWALDCPVEALGEALERRLRDGRSEFAIGYGVLDGLANSACEATDWTGKVTCWSDQRFTGIFMRPGDVSIVIDHPLHTRHYQGAEDLPAGETFTLQTFAAKLMIFGYDDGWQLEATDSCATGIIPPKPSDAVINSLSACMTAKQCTRENAEILDRFVGVMF